MPVLDISAAQAFFQNHSSPLRDQFLIHRKVLSSPVLFGDEKRPVNLSKYFHLAKTKNGCERSRLQVNAVATLQPQSVVIEDERSMKSLELDHNSNGLTIEAGSSNMEPSDLHEDERLRRTKISKANKGNIPWNKGKKHSPETIQRIRERTKLAMQNPKVKMKLANLGHAQSKETKEKIGMRMQMRWKKHHQKMIVQETCFFQWQNLIAEASRRGYVGEEVLQWDSYKIITEKLEVEWVESIERRKETPRPKGIKRTPKSPEQRQKIAEAIAAKWADPEYRERVCAGMSKYHGVPVGVKPRRKPSTLHKKQNQAKEKSVSENFTGSDTAIPTKRPRLRRSKMPPCKDPLVSSKMEMIKNIRVNRAATEARQMEAIERARLLIAEAQEAAKSLEIAATKSPIARASLIETRKLIAEAIRLIESIDTRYLTCSEDDVDHFLAPTELSVKETNLRDGNFSRADFKEVSGTKILALSKDEDLKDFNISPHIKRNGENIALSTTPNGYSLPGVNLDSIMEHSSSLKQIGRENTELEKSPLPNGLFQHVKPGSPSKSVTRTKKWVRGRFIEVTDEEHC